MYVSTPSGLGLSFTASGTFKAGSDGVTSSGTTNVNTTTTSPSPAPQPGGLLNWIGSTVKKIVKPVLEPAPVPVVQPGAGATVQQMAAGAVATQQAYARYISESKVKLMTQCGLTADQASVVLGKGSSAIQSKLATCGSAKAMATAATAMQQQYALTPQPSSGIPWWVWLGGAVVVGGGAYALYRRSQ